jgi:two-component system response regulator FixJ
LKVAGTILVDGHLAMHEQNERARARPVIAIVDDDAAVLNSLKFSLQTEGFEVQAYSDGSALLDAGRLPDVDCMVIDQKLPGMSGLDVVAELRQRQYAMPAVLITSDPNLEVRIRAAKAGIPIVEKPILGNALMESIRALVERHWTSAANHDGH